MMEDEKDKGASESTAGRETEEEAGTNEWKQARGEDRRKNKWMKNKD